MVETQSKDGIIDQVSNNPLVPAFHFDLAQWYREQGEWYVAISECRMSIALGNNDIQAKLFLMKAYMAIGQPDLANNIKGEMLREDDKDVTKDINSLKSKNDIKENPLTNLDHNVYYRIKSLSDHISSLFSHQKISILDVGGGSGVLSLFLPGANYCLAEPSVNGISGNNLPFNEKSFDVVVACHVLEHIPKGERNYFLKRICSVAKKYVILLNPFFVKDSFVNERLDLLIEITNASWAKEHKECSLPHLDEIVHFAKKNNIGFKVSPNGSLTTGMAMSFVSYFAQITKRGNELDKINHLYNTYYFDKLSNSQMPMAYLIELNLLTH